MSKRYIYDNQHIAEGDIFYSSWGYDQTNIDYYKVKKKIGKGSAIIVPVENKIVGDNTYTDAVIPYPASEGKPFRARIKYACWDDFKTPRISLGYRDARLWDGIPKNQTNPNYWR
jgi:hypothetical protein